MVHTQTLVVFLEIWGETRTLTTLVLQNDPQFILSGVSLNPRAFSGGLDIYAQVCMEDKGLDPYHPCMVYLPTFG